MQTLLQVRVLVLMILIWLMSDDSIWFCLFDTLSMIMTIIGSFKVEVLEYCILNRLILR